MELENKPSDCERQTPPWIFSQPITGHIQTIIQAHIREWELRRAPCMEVSEPLTTPSGTDTKQYSTIKVTIRICKGK